MNGFQEYYSEHGICRQCTVAHTQQLNGVVEHINYAILYSYGSCSKHFQFCGLEKDFQAEAANTGNHLVNHSLTVALGYQIPEDIWSEKPVNYFLIRTFDCDLYIWIPKEQRTKLNAKSKKCSQLCNSNKRAQTWDSSLCKVIDSRYVMQ